MIIALGHKIPLKSWPFFFEYDRLYGTDFYIIHASNFAPKDLSPTLKRVKGIPERLEM